MYLAARLKSDTFQRVFVGRDDPCGGTCELVFERSAYRLIELEDVLILRESLAVRRVHHDERARLLGDLHRGRDARVPSGHLRGKGLFDFL